MGVREKRGCESCVGGGLLLLMILSPLILRARVLFFEYTFGNK